MPKIHKLTPLQIKNTTKLGWLADGGGLYLRIRNNGTKTWIFRQTKNKQRKDYTIGPVNTLSLASAREIAGQCRLATFEGRDIVGALNRDVEGHTFKDAARAIIKRREKSWKSIKTHIRWRRGLMDHAKPLHKISVNQITVKDVESVIRPIWYTMNHSARMTRGMIEQAMDLATVLGWRTGDNPARWKGTLEYLLPDHKPKVQHHAAMPYADVPAYYKDLLSSNHAPRAALALTMLTASRGHMVRHADWDEFDLDENLWTIPTERMKRSNEDHVIPLTPTMLALLPKSGKGLIFPYRGKGFSENAFRSTLKAMNQPYTAHGFRSTFKDWAMDCTNFGDEISELALAHKVGSSVRRAYRRGKGLDLRRQLMAAWCDYLV
jgi:integrase